MKTTDELEDALESPMRLVKDPKKELDEFKKFATDLMCNFQIRKGKDKLYWMTDIEFYVYTDSHRDIITYPRNCKAGRWFFHPSGVDLSFESLVDSEARFLVKKPKLTKESIFGGILIRGIVMVDNPSINADGPYKVCDELFDQFDAIDAPIDFPRIVAASSPRKVSPTPLERKGLDEEAKTKVPKILKNYYSGWDIPEEELIKSHDTYRQKQYRFVVG